MYRLWESKLLRTLAAVLFLLQWSVDGFIDATLNYFVDRGFFGVAPSTLIVWFAIQIIIGIMFWLPWFQHNLSRQNSLTVISAIIGLVSLAITFAFEHLKPWYPYAIGVIVSPIFVLLPLIFNWATEQIESDDEAGEVIGALTAVRACSGILGAFLPAALAFSGHWCETSDAETPQYYNAVCGGGPPKYLWNCGYFGVPWLIGTFASVVAIAIIRIKLRRDGAEKEPYGDQGQLPRRSTRFTLLPGLLGAQRVHPSIIYGGSSTKEYQSYTTMETEYPTRHTISSTPGFTSGVDPACAPSNEREGVHDTYRSHTTLY